MAAPDSTQRFSDRVSAYLAGRPGYPPALVEHLRGAGALLPQATVVDLGAGTGLSAEPFLQAGYTVLGVEPNAAMRAGGDDYLARYPHYRSQAGRAEATGLPAAIAQLVVAGQAFHWFDPATARAEALRLLVPGGWAALFWNERDQSTPFGAGYQQLCHDFGPEFAQVRDRDGGDQTAAAVFFGGAAPPAVTFTHARRLDWPQLLALASSVSYLPAEGTPQHAALTAALRALFDAHAQDGRVEMRYICRLHAAPLR